ncbi:MAG: GxxExxY protein [Candidatus Methylacidiphilales bacterium]
MNKKLLDEITYNIIGAAIEVHKALGTGLLESVYHQCMKHELALRNISFDSKLTMPVHYKGINLNTELRCDLFVEEFIVVELKNVEKIAPIHEAQIHTYMKLLHAPKGVIINFNSFNIFNDGQKTVVNEFYRQLNDE